MPLVLMARPMKTTCTIVSSRGEHPQCFRLGKKNIKKLGVNALKRTFYSDIRMQWSCTYCMHCSAGQISWKAMHNGRKCNQHGQIATHHVDDPVYGKTMTAPPKNRSSQASRRLVTMNECSKQSTGRMVSPGD